MIVGGAFAGQQGDGGAAKAHGEHGLAGNAVEDEDVAGFGEAGHDIDPAAVARDGEEVGRGADVEIPNVVAHVLEVPAAFAGEHIERDDAVAEEIVAEAVDADHVGARGAKGDEREPSGIVNGKTAPAVSAGAGFDPSLGAEVGIARNGAKSPELLAGAHVVAEGIAEETRRHEDVAEDRARGRGPGGEQGASGRPERGEGFAGFWIQGVDEISGADEQARRVFGVAGPVNEAAAGGVVLESFGSWIVR